jgi:hypothetical protein
MCVEGCEMVKVRRMTRAKLILLITGMLVANVTGAHASFWKRSAAAKAPTQAATAAPTGMLLTAIDVEMTPSPRLVLRTTASPVYTSYSPMPDVFVIDLTGASKASSLVIPSMVPSSLGSVSVEEVTEMGSRLTRVTLHLAQPASIEAAAEENSIAINLPASTTAVAEAAPAMRTEEVPPLVKAVPDAPKTETLTAEVKTEETTAPIISEPIAEAARPAIEPAVVAESLPSTVKAKALRKIETRGAGTAMEVSIATDGDVTYNTFKLQKPARAVIDLDGVNNKLLKNLINVSDPVVKRIRISQFKNAPQPVTRVVLDLDENATYHVTKIGDALHVTFEAGPALTATPPVPAPKPEQPLVAATPAPPPPAIVVTAKAATPADIPAQVPTIAESPAWKMPERPKRATSVINAPQDQVPPSASKRRNTISSPMSTPIVDPTPPGENVFTDPQPAAAPQSASVDRCRRAHAQRK